MSRTQSVLSVTLAALALSFGTVHAASAAPLDGGSAQHVPDTGAQAHGEHHGDRASFIRKLERLHAQLNLNGDQEKLWRSAVGLMKSNFAAERTSRRQAHAELHTMMQQPILDLNALHAAREKMADQAHQRREQTTAAWLNLYNTLDNQQKTTVSTALKTHWARMEKMRHHWHHEMQHRKPGAGAPAQGDMPPPAAPQSH